MKKKILGLIPTRLSSKRLHQKPLLKINGIPIFIHTYLRAKESKILDDLIICCDDVKIINIAKKYGAKAILTSKKCKNGTERIYEGYKKINKKFDYIVDIQGDEPLINPKHIDSVINFHIKNRDASIILPSIQKENIETKNIVKVVADNNGKVLYLSRLPIPFSFKGKKKTKFKTPINNFVYTKGIEKILLFQANKTRKDRGCRVVKGNRNRHFNENNYIKRR
jgi:3-deoxy-manno-octulosonate cytidylyltransferase (CMP-KDO synthetase)